MQMAYVTAFAPSILLAPHGERIEVRVGLATVAPLATTSQSQERYVKWGRGKTEMG